MKDMQIYAGAEDGYNSKPPAQHQQQSVNDGQSDGEAVDQSYLEDMCKMMSPSERQTMIQLCQKMNQMESTRSKSEQPSSSGNEGVGET